MAKRRAKRKKKDDTKKDDTKETRTIVSLNPFTKFERNIIDFMASISKNIYNSSIFCHQIYDFYYHFIYTELFCYCKKIILDSQKDDLLQNPNLLINSLHTELLNICNRKHKLYSDRFKIINDNFYKLYSIIKTHNQLRPIVNNNYHTTIRLLTSYLTKYIIYLDDELPIYMKKIVDTINMFYMKNFNDTKEEIINHSPCKINDLSFMDDVKNNKCIVKQYPISNLKKKIQEYIEHELNIDNKDNPNEYLKSDRYIIKCFTYKNLGTNLEKLPADVTLNIIDKAYDSYLSFYALKQKGIGCSKPDFLPKESKYNLFYTASSRKQITINKIEYMRITLGEYVSKNYVEISKSEMLFMDFKSKKLKYSKYINEFGNKHNIFNEQYMYITIPTILKNKSIGLMNISPVNDGFKYKICYSYKIDKIEIKNYDVCDVNNYVFGDLGMTNLITFHDPKGDKQYIISGKEIGSINKYYNNILDNKKSEISEIGIGSWDKIRATLVRRENKINTLFDNICKWISETYADKKCIVLGYNKSWKNKINLGRKTNRLFYGIPFMKLINKLKFKLNKEGKDFKITEEAYTSKCDALGLEEIGKHEKYMGERIRRGLYSSSTRNLINADMNGAINIGRKYMKRMGVEMEEINEKGIYNPKKIKMICKKKLGSSEEPPV